MPKVLCCPVLQLPGRGRGNVVAACRGVRCAGGVWRVGLALVLR